jgi:hypothetical protein
MALLALLSAPAPATAQGGMAQFIPPAEAGCPRNVKVELEASSWSPTRGMVGGASNPQVGGYAVVLNGETYSVPIQDVSVQIFPSNSAVSPITTECWGSGNGRVPASPIPYQYGKSSCSFQADLPTRGPSAGARNWQKARAVVTLTNGAKCFSKVTSIARHGGGGGGGANPPSWDGPMVGGAVGGGRRMLEEQVVGVVAA